MSPRGDDRHAVTTQPAETTGTRPPVALGAQRAQVRPSVVDGDNHPGRKKKRQESSILSSFFRQITSSLSLSLRCAQSDQKPPPVARRLFDFSHVAGSGGMGGGRGRGEGCCCILEVQRHGLLSLKMGHKINHILTNSRMFVVELTHSLFQL